MAVKGLTNTTALPENNPTQPVALVTETTAKVFVPALIGEGATIENGEVVADVV